VRFGARRLSLRAHPAVVRARGIVELRAPEVDEKKLRNEPNHVAGILADTRIASLGLAAWVAGELFGRGCLV
jgi:hypothetical protein